MAKIYGLFGAMTGKMADSVMSVRNGVQIVRKYQPVVYNPSTPAQIESRAKLKLLSQLSAIMAPIIAMPKQGNVSSRNIFTRENYKALTYADGEAQVVLTSVKLTKSVVALPSLSVTRSASTNLTAQLSAPAPGLSRVVYVLFVKSGTGELYYGGSRIVSIPGTDNTYVATFEYTESNVVVYAYGIRDNTEAARAIFGDITVPYAEDVAQLITTRRLTENDVTLTETKAAALQG